MWDTESYLPKATLSDHAESILLVFVPETDIQPLEPREIGSEGIRQLVLDGKDVCFITAGGVYGVATLVDGAIRYLPRRDVIQIRVCRSRLMRAIVAK